MSPTSPALPPWRAASGRHFKRFPPRPTLAFGAPTSNIKRSCTTVILGLPTAEQPRFFYVLSWFLLPRFGLNVGFVLGYVVSIGYLFVLKLVTDRLLKKTEPQKAKA